MNNVLQDLKYTLRTLLKKPGFAATAILTLALGIGANTAIFSVVRAVLLAPLPFAEPDRVAMIWSHWANEDKGWVGPAEYADYLDQLTTAESVAVWRNGSFNLTGDGDPERLPGVGMTANTLDVLGAVPALGRMFTTEEELQGLASCVILSDALWRRRYEADPEIIGRVITLQGQACPVIGVMPPGFRMPTDFGNTTPAMFWMPLGLNPSTVDRSYRGNHGLLCAARLRDGVTTEAMNGELTSLFARWTNEDLYPAEQQMTAYAVPVEQEIVGDVRPAMLVLLGAAGLLLLIACVNVANLLLARCDDRRRELAIRSALGGGRGRLISQLLTESLMLALAGGLGGILVASFATDGLMALRPEALPRVTDAQLDLTVLLFTLIVSVLTGVAFGVAPALRAVATDLNPLLKEGSGGSGASRERHRFQGGLVVVQLALAVLLLSGAGLMTRSFLALTQVDPGFASRDMLTFRVSLPSTDYPDVDSQVQFYETAMDELRSIPGAISVGAISRLPLDGEIGDWNFLIEGRPDIRGQNPVGDWKVATPGYFEAMSMRLLEGRIITTDDRAEAEPVAVLNEALAKKYWPEGDAIGQRIRMGGPTSSDAWVRIVGIVADVRHDRLDQPIKPTYYRPHAQLASSVGFTMGSMSFVIQSAGDPHQLVAPARARLAAIDPNLPIANVQSMDRIVADSVAGPRFTTVLLGAFALVALALASIGVYGVMAFSVGQRRQEIGVRIAMGATPRNVLTLVMRRGLGLAGVGLGLGVLATVIGARALSSQLFEVEPFDPLTLVVVVGVLGASVVAACGIPARRALGVNPIQVLRDE